MIEDTTKKEKNHKEINIDNIEISSTTTCITAIHTSTAKHEVLP